MNEITIEQALINVEQGLNAFVGKKSDHILLEQSLNLIKTKLMPITPSVEELVKE
jgi:hypothetical protein